MGAARGNRPRERKTYFLYDGTNPVCELDASGNVTAVNTFGSGLISRHASSGSTFYAFDPQGNVVQRVTSGGVVTSVQDYTAYGQTLSSFNPPNQTDPFGYEGEAGYYTDHETGLLYLTNRYYDPTRARFLNRDPADYDGGINLYGYCGNDPVSDVDPLGLWPAMTDPDGSPSYWGCVVSGGEVGGAATLSAFSFGYYNGGKYRCDPSFATSAALAGVGRDCLLTATGEGASAKLAEIAENARCESLVGKLLGKGCFVAGTPVQMADGTTKPIEQVQNGDLVLSRNEQTGKTESKRVVETQAYEDVSTLALHFTNGETIVTTDPHPFYVKDEGFVAADRLAIGDAVVTRTGTATAIAKIEHLPAATVYNLTVEDDHTYFVGNNDGGVWVHNDELCELHEEA